MPPPSLPSASSPPLYVAHAPSSVLLSQVRPLSLSASALLALNLLLDEILHQILHSTTSPSLSPGLGSNEILTTERIKVGVIRVLGSIGKLAVLEAEICTREVLKRSGTGMRSDPALRKYCVAVPKGERKGEEEIDGLGRALRTFVGSLSTLGTNLPLATSSSSSGVPLPPIPNEHLSYLLAFYTERCLTFLATHILLALGRVCEREAGKDVIGLREMEAALGEEEALWCWVRKTRVWEWIGRELRKGEGRPGTTTAKGTTGGVGIGIGRGGVGSIRGSTASERKEVLLPLATTKIESEALGTGFEQLMSSGQTMKVSLTPSRLVNEQRNGRQGGSESTIRLGSLPALSSSQSALPPILNRSHLPPQTLEDPPPELDYSPRARFRPLSALRKSAPPPLPRKETEETRGNETEIMSIQMERNGISSSKSSDGTWNSSNEFASLEFITRTRSSTTTVEDHIPLSPPSGLQSTTSLPPVPSPMSSKSPKKGRLRGFLVAAGLTKRPSILASGDGVGGDGKREGVAGGLGRKGSRNFELETGSGVVVALREDSLEGVLPPTPPPPVPSRKVGTPHSTFHPASLDISPSPKIKITTPSPAVSRFVAPSLVASRHVPGVPLPRTVNGVPPSNRPPARSTARPVTAPLTGVRSARAGPGAVVIVGGSASSDNLEKLAQRKHEDQGTVKVLRRGMPIAKSGGDGEGTTTALGIGVPSSTRSPSFRTVEPGAELGGGFAVRGGIEPLRSTSLEGKSTMREKQDEVKKNEGGSTGVLNNPLPLPVSLPLTNETSTNEGTSTSPVVLIKQLLQSIESPNTIEECRMILSDFMAGTLETARKGETKVVEQANFEEEEVRNMVQFFLGEFEDSRGEERHRGEVLQQVEGRAEPAISTEPIPLPPRTTHLALSSPLTPITPSPSTSASLTEFDPVKNLCSSSSRDRVAIAL